MYTERCTDSTPVRGELAYTSLKGRLLRGDFLFGVRLAESRLATELDVSRTPVREALGRLHAEGLVDRHPQGGYCPSAPDLHEIRELYEVRAALELDAISRPLRTGVPHDRDALLGLAEDWAALDADDRVEPSPEVVLLDEDFHIGLAAASGNRSLADLLARVNERIRIVRMQDFLSPERVASTIAQHRSVLDALLADEPGVAKVRLVAHFEESLAVVEQRSAAALARMLVAGREAR